MLVCVVVDPSPDELPMLPLPKSLKKRREAAVKAVPQREEDVQEIEELEPLPRAQGKKPQKETTGTLRALLIAYVDAEIYTKTRPNSCHLHQTPCPHLQLP